MPKNMLNRRDFLRNTGLGLAGLGLSSSGLFERRANAASLTGKRMIFIFQEGGNDGINTLIPRGDSDYNTRNRPTLFIPEDEALDTGNGFAQLHPALEPMMEIYNSRSLNGVSGPGNLAVLHRIGYDGQSRSHFDSQHFWQNGMPGDAETEEGFIYRRLNAIQNLNSGENGLVAAGLSSNQMLALKGEKLIPNFNSARDFTFPAGDKFLGVPAQRSDYSDARGISGLFSLPPRTQNGPYNSLVYAAGQSLAGTMEQVQEAIGTGNYNPANGAVYPNNGFGRKLQDAAILMKRTDIQVLGLQIGGWDTHKGQGTTSGGHPRLLGELAQGFQALSRDLEDQWEDTIIVTMTEFGRTSKENGSRGTDHAESSVMFVAGGGVKGGVYNCDPDTWERRAMFSARDRYLASRTDFRAVFSEIFQEHFGDDSRIMNDIMPGYDIAKLDRPQAFRQLGFIRG